MNIGIIKIGDTNFIGGRRNIIIIPNLLVQIRKRAKRKDPENVFDLQFLSDVFFFFI